jgi:hypothetical protein
MSLRGLAKVLQSPKDASGMLVTKPADEPRVIRVKRKAKPKHAFLPRPAVERATVEAVEPSPVSVKPRSPKRRGGRRSALAAARSRKRLEELARPTSTSPRFAERRHSPHSQSSPISRTEYLKLQKQDALVR